MKINNIITDIYQRTGLWLINGLARSDRYRVSGDIAFGPHKRQTLDHYTLSDGESRPTVLFFYGGNWRSGAKQDYRFVADTLLWHGFNVIVPDYRLYPLVRFADIRADAVAALETAVELAGTSDLFVMGHSAGAQLATLLTLDDSLSPASKAIKGCIGLSGPYDFYPFTDDDHWDLFAPENGYLESQAVSFVRADAAPLYLLHGAEDTRVRRGHSKSLMEKQQAAGGIASREVYPALGHADLIVQFSRLHRDKAQVVKDLARFIQQTQAAPVITTLKEAVHGT